MKLAKLVIIITALLLVFGVLAESKPNWSYEIVSIEVKNESPDILTIDIRRNRVSRGVYAVSGSIEIKQDLTDDLHISGYEYYSPTGNYNYVRTAFQVPDKALTDFLNTIYKDVLMESLQQCAKNAPLFENDFVAPLTKRLISLNNCEISNENMPSLMKIGYHKIIINIINQVNVTAVLLFKVERE